MTNLIKRIGNAELEVMLDAVRRVENDAKLLERAGITKRRLERIGENIFITMTERSSPGIWDLVHRDFSALGDVVRAVELSGLELPEERSALSVLLAQNKSKQEAQHELRLGRRVRSFDILTKRAYTVQSGDMWTRVWYGGEEGLTFTLALNGGTGLESHWLYVSLFPDAAEQCIAGVKLAIGKAHKKMAVPSSKMFDIKIDGRRPRFNTFKPDKQIGIPTIEHRAQLNALRSLYLSVGLVPRVHSMFIHPLTVS
jgi:hypothetical protein